MLRYQNVPAAANVAKTLAAALRSILAAAGAVGQHLCRRHKAQIPKKPHPINFKPRSLSWGLGGCGGGGGGGGGGSND